jgi:adenosine deaminase
VEVLDKEPASTAISKYDAILTFRVVSWGIRLIQEEPDLMSPFIELEVKMVYVPTSKVLWDDCDKYIGQNRFPLHAYQNQKELCKKEIQETIVDVVEYISRMLLPPKTSS